MFQCKYSTARFLVALAAVSMTAGCAHVNFGLPEIDDVSKQRQQRQEKLVHAFDQKRDAAQYQAALSRWQQSDARGCREQLVLLLRRNPEYRPAKYLLAELHLFQNNPQNALAMIQEVMDEFPNDAQANHIMAMLLDATGEQAAAMAHFQRAVDLSPDNELYRLSYETAHPSALASSKVVGAVSPDSEVRPARHTVPIGP